MKESLIKILLTVLFTIIYFFLQQKLSIIFLLLWIGILTSFGESIVAALISTLIIIIFFIKKISLLHISYTIWTIWDKKIIIKHEN